MGMGTRIGARAFREGGTRQERPAVPRGSRGKALGYGAGALPAGPGGAARQQFRPSRFAW